MVINRIQNDRPANESEKPPSASISKIDYQKSNPAVQECWKTVQQRFANMVNKSKSSNPSK